MRTQSIFEGFVYSNFILLYYCLHFASSGKHVREMCTPPPPQTPLFNNKTGVCRGIPIFLIFAPKCTPPPKPHFLIIKLGYAGVYLFFLFLLQNIDYGYSLEPPREVVLTVVYPQSMFWSKNKKNSIFFFFY